ncbi:MAG: transcriptional regulator [Archangium sp.]
MNDSQWDAKLKSFLKKTGDDFKRFGTEVKAEAQKLLTEVQDPQRQKKLREGLENVGVWARKTADDVANVVEDGVKFASERVGEFIHQPVDSKGEPPPPSATPPSPPPEMDEEPGEPAPKKAKKSVGKSAAKKPATSAAKKSGGKKTIGKKKA